MRPLPTDPDPVLLDLDGTIIRSGPVITRSLRETLRAFEAPVPADEELVPYIGPPLPQTLHALTGASGPRLADMVTYYRGVYATHMDLGTLFPGMAELVRSLAALGRTVALATSKRESVACTILDRAGLLDCFTMVSGASEDETRATKAEVVADALAALTTHGHTPQRAVMVGDRHHDVEGAGAHGIPTIVCRWGYGSEVDERGAALAVDTPAELASALGAPLPPT